MSLIQQALEKTNPVQETKTTTPAPASKPWNRDPMGAALEQKLTQVQQSHAKQRGLYWKVTLSVLFLCFVAWLFYVVETQQIQPGVKTAPVATTVPAVVEAPQLPLKIDSGNIYRLTGVTDLGGRSIAVINGRLLGVGDTLDDKAVVRAIGDGKVLLDVQGKELKLVL